MDFESEIVALNERIDEIKEALRLMCSYMDIPETDKHKVDVAIDEI